MSDAAEFGYPGLAPTLQPTGNATKYIFIEPHLNNELDIDFSFYEQLWNTSYELFDD